MNDFPSIFKTNEGYRQYLTAYENALSLWPVPFQSLDVPTRLGSTHVVASGPQDAPPLVLLHGAGNSATMWYPLVGALSERYRTYALDTIGDGGKSRLSRSPQRRSDYAGWLEDVFDGLGIDQAFVVGLSYGGWLALNLALSAPQRVIKLVLLAPAASFVRFNRIFDFMLHYGHLLPFQMKAEKTVRWLTDKDTVVDARYLAVLDAVTTHGKMDILYPDVYTDGEMRSLRTPIRLVYGDQEVIYNTQAAAERARRLVPDLEVEFIPKAGHFLPMDQPARIAASILSFFSEEKLPIQEAHLELAA